MNSTGDVLCDVFFSLTRASYLMNSSMAVIEFGKFGEWLWDECHCCGPFEIRMEIDLNYFRYRK